MHAVLEVVGTRESRKPLVWKNAVVLGALTLAVASWVVPKLGTRYQAGCFYIAPAHSISLVCYMLYIGVLVKL